jgi:hypothetical protein
MVVHAGEIGQTAVSEGAVHMAVLNCVLWVAVRNRVAGRMAVWRCLGLLGRIR